MHYNSDQLRDYQFGLLDESETAAIAVHLKTCADCRAELERIQQQFSALDLLKEQPAVSEATVAKTVEAIATSESTPPSAQTTRKMIPFRSAAAALAAAASIAIIFGLFGRDRSPNGPDESRTAGILPAEKSRQDAGDTIKTLTELRAEKPFAPASNIELNVLPRRDDVQLTIYNEEDLTLVREKRKLTLKRGWNWLQFMWSNTLIDPTSLALEPKTHGDQIEITQLVYPPRLNELARWTIFSKFDGEAEFELTYLTCGIKWNAFYEATLSPDEQSMQLRAFVRVDNGSGEDYENAETRLVVGTINLEDQIAELARRQHAYGSPVIKESERFTDLNLNGTTDIAKIVNGSFVTDWSYDTSEMKDDYFYQKEILKQALSEYQLYTIEGRETIPDGWGKRLPSFDVQEIGVTNLYKYDEQRWGNSTMRFLSFANTETCKLGDNPLPNGYVRVFHNVDRASSSVVANRSNVHNEAGSSVYDLSYIGATSIKYIPVGEEVELDLGTAQKVRVEPRLMKFATDNYRYFDGDISGWDEITNWKLEITNTRDLPVEIEITRSTGSYEWEISTDTPYEKQDTTRVRFTVRLEPRSKKEIHYQLTVHHGTRADGK